MHNHHCFSFSAYFGRNALTFPYALKTEGYLQLEQPLFLRMSSGVVPKTNLTFCSTPCEKQGLESGPGCGVPSWPPLPAGSPPTGTLHVCEGPCPRDPAQESAPGLAQTVGWVPRRQETREGLAARCPAHVRLLSGALCPKAPPNLLPGLVLWRFLRPLPVALPLLVRPGAHGRSVSGLCVT